MSNNYTLILKNAHCYIDKKLVDADLGIKDNIITKINPPIHEEADKVLDATGLAIFPGIIDTQVHFREPGSTKRNLGKR